MTVKGKSSLSRANAFVTDRVTDLVTRLCSFLVVVFVVLIVADVWSSSSQHNGGLSSSLNNATCCRPIWKRSLRHTDTIHNQETRTSKYANVSLGACFASPVPATTRDKPKTLNDAVSECESVITEYDKTRENACKQVSLRKRSC